MKIPVLLASKCMLGMFWGLLGIGFTQILAIKRSVYTQTYIYDFFFFNLEKDTVFTTLTTWLEDESIYDLCNTFLTKLSGIRRLANHLFIFLFRRIVFPQPLCKGFIFKGSGHTIFHLDFPEGI